MAMATVSKFDTDAYRLVDASALTVGDLVARVTAKGEIGQERVVLTAADTLDGRIILGFPKRYTVDADADPARWADENGRYLVVGRVTPPAPKSAKKSDKPAAASPNTDRPAFSEVKVTTAPAVQPAQQQPDAVSAALQTLLSALGAQQQQPDMAQHADAIRAIADTLYAQADALVRVADALTS